MKILKCNHLVLAIVIGTAAIGSAQNRMMKTRSYDAAKEITVQGAVEEVLTPQRGAMMGVHLKLKTEAESFEVRLGPAWFLEQKHFSFKKGDQISVTGATLATRTGQAIIAREVKKGGAVLELRDGNGIPRWSGRRLGFTG
jgi:hypothetical protein